MGFFAQKATYYLSIKVSDKPKLVWNFWHTSDGLHTILGIIDGLPSAT
ncbi:hypothetical protein D1BOALGB6SA_7092 [Olavius sp. associated proteobacterium Delta 1]|nr:hypothetical protein D1BOALGB6SA_7092 [Olavius sp. associated proteobacterium Delta 1]